MKFNFLHFILLTSISQTFAQIKEVNEYIFWNELHLKYFEKISYHKIDGLLWEYEINNEFLKKLNNILYACICPINDYHNYEYYSFENNIDLRELFCKVQFGYSIKLYYHQKDIEKIIGQEFLKKRHTDNDGQVFKTYGKLVFNRPMRKWEIIGTQYYHSLEIDTKLRLEHGLKGEFTLKNTNGQLLIIGYKKPSCENCVIL